jgi:UDP-N-acetyl-alpha-D-muramoyl-L-alanyl-L-glutamate epimerase
VSVFRYESLSTDADRGLLTCRYSVDGRDFAERVTLAPGERWNSPEAQSAARLVYLLAGVSYYKTTAAPQIHVHGTSLTELERDFLREFYVQGLGEFAYKNNLDLTNLEISGAEGFKRAPAPSGLRSDDEGGATREDGAPKGARIGGSGGSPPRVDTGAHVQSSPSPSQPSPYSSRPSLRPLIPFGGGIDSIVTVEKIRALAPDSALFVVSKPEAGGTGGRPPGGSSRFDAIERPAAVAGLPVVRAGREIDPQLLRSAELGFLNGHVPVTGIISAIAILAAVLDGRDAVIMSNEWSASIPTLEYNGQPVNHQYSKSASFEAAFRQVLAASPAALPDYFSALRDRTELWVGDEFARLGEYRTSFRSCNRAFPIDAERRLDHWCGQCDKCCFIDLILAPFLPAAALREVFDVVPEPLDVADLAGKFRTLLGSGTKPFECVGEVNECRAAVLLAARRPDRADCALLQELAAEVAGRPDAPTEADIAAMRRPVGENFIPAAYAFAEDDR